MCTNVEDDDDSSDANNGEDDEGGDEVFVCTLFVCARGFSNSMY